MISHFQAALVNEVAILTIHRMIHDEYIFTIRSSIGQTDAGTGRYLAFPQALARGLIGGKKRTSTIT